MRLNEISKISYENAKKREANGAFGKVDDFTFSMLKHCATEVVEAAGSYEAYKNIKDVANNSINVLLKLGYESDLQNAARKKIVDGYKSNFAGELADIICCVAIIAEEEGIDLDEAVSSCLEKNSRRAEGKGDKL